MLKVNPTPAQLKRIKNTQKKLLAIPEDWEQFISLTQIRSVGAKGAEMRNFTPYYYQKLLHYLTRNYSGIDVIKSRQTGLTTSAAGIFLHDACMNEAYSAVCFMRNQIDTGNLSKRIRRMVESLDRYVIPQSDNVGYLKLQNMGELHFRNSSKEGCRSLDCVSGQLFDEAAFVEHMGDIYSASAPSSALLGDKATKICVSTPGARSGFYWDKINTDNPTSHADLQNICDQVAEGRLTCNGHKGVYWWETADKRTARLVVHFSAHPEYGKMPVQEYLEYRQSQEPGSSWEDIEREYNLKFLDSSVAIFPYEIVTEACKSYEYETEPDPRANYYGGLDTATTGQDYVVGFILKELDGNYSVSAIYRKRHQTQEYHLHRLQSMFECFNPQSVGVEVTGGVGQTYLERLARNMPGIRFEAINTTQTTKGAMISLLLLALEEHKLIYPSKSPILEELVSFRRNGKKLEAAEGKHDDCVMSLAFSLMVTPFKNEKNRAFIKTNHTALFHSETSSNISSEISLFTA